MSESSNLDDADKEFKLFVSAYSKVCALLEDAGNVTAEAMALILILGEILFCVWSMEVGHNNFYL